MNIVIGLFPGECREPAFMRELEALVKEWKLTDSVLFLGRRDDILDLLKLMDVLIIPSAFEGCHFAGLEAVSAGVPVAACNVAGARKFVEVSNGGTVFSEDDVGKAADVVLECFRNRDYVVESKKFAERAKVMPIKEKFGAVLRNVRHDTGR